MRKALIFCFSLLISSSGWAENNELAEDLGSAAGGVAGAAVGGSMGGAAGAVAGKYGVRAGGAVAQGLHDQGVEINRNMQRDPEGTSTQLRNGLYDERVRQGR